MSRPTPRGTTLNGVEASYPAALAEKKEPAVSFGFCGATRFLSEGRVLVEPVVAASQRCVSATCLCLGFSLKHQCCDAELFRYA